MLKLIVSLTIFFAYSFAITKSEIVELYQKKEFLNLCKKTEWSFTKFKNDETILSIISLSCIKADKLNSAIRTSRFMKNRKEGRANATYIANLYLMKRLLIQFVFDHIKLSGVSLPKSNHFLSIIFDNIANNNYIQEGNKYIIKKDNIVYTLEPLNSSKKGAGIIITIINNNHKYRHLFW